MSNIRFKAYRKRLFKDTSSKYDRDIYDFPPVSIETSGHPSKELDKLINLNMAAETFMDVL